ncbi:VOC family protein [Aeromicrobium massiliense]|uniref:VOC family protein n=1 Tax=Aeromicrobium massiliense TaxID=1464554 RepID=UPI0002F7CAA3|nr:VOC family protein [Aeromicrobium massiliense]
MHLENLVVDAADPARFGRFWQAALGGEPLTDDADGFETRVAVPGGPVLDVCFQPVPGTPPPSPRLHLDLRGGTEQDAVVERLLGLGARHLDVGQGAVPWVVLADPEGNPFCVLEERAVDPVSGPVSALPLDSADPGRDVAFWAWLSGWTEVDGLAPRTLQHPSGRGPLLELCPEPGPKGAAKNRLHLDMRLDPGDDPDEVAAGIAERGGRALAPLAPGLPWWLFADPSGNEVCLLPAPA